MDFMSIKASLEAIATLTILVSTPIYAFFRVLDLIENRKDRKQHERMLKEQEIYNVGVYAQLEEIRKISEHLPKG